MSSKKTFLFVMIFGLVLPARSDSLLTAQSFPRGYDDLPFMDKMALLADGYSFFEREYDSDGNCISGCPYKGINIIDDMNAVDEATEEFAKIVDQEIKNEIASGGLGNQDTNVFYTAVSTSVDYDEGAPNWCKTNLPANIPLRPPVDLSKIGITSDFGFRGNSQGSKFHPAVDIEVAKGTPVYATAFGKVIGILSPDSSGGGGWVVNIQHDKGLVTQYLHLKSRNDIFVRVGDTVLACQKIALSGDTGIGSAHLDYRIRFAKGDNKFIDIFCPCKSAQRMNSNEGTGNIPTPKKFGFGNNSCKSSAFNKEYVFYGKKNIDWRIKNYHCLPNTMPGKNNYQLPDEKDVI